MTVTY